MHWGDTQSFFQVSLALNLAYYSFREVWSPISDQHADVLRAIDDDAQNVRARLSKRLVDETVNEEDRRRGQIWLERIDVNGLGVSARVYRSAICDLRFAICDLFGKAEQTIGKICLTDAALSLVFLVYATLHYAHRLSAGWFWFIMAITILPIIVIYCFNLLLLREVRREVRVLNETRKQRERYWAEFIKEFPSNI
jgi:hypothetical protein